MLRSIILYTVQQHNILPLTSHCNSRCLFCSHHGNVPGLQIFSVGMRKFDEVIEDITFLDSKRDIIIGESATRIIEGEPFLHPQIIEILAAIRERHPSTPIKITTNGTLFNENKVSLLAQLEKLEINLSLNAATPSQHKELMANTVSAEALKEGFWFKKYSLPFHGSLVAMPWVTGWSEIEETLKYLEDIGALSVRVFMAGFSNNSPAVSNFAQNHNKELISFISQKKQHFKIPILLEPPFLKDFKPEIAGVLKNSIAEEYRLKTGDVILSVNGKKVAGRVDAWQTITRLEDPDLKILSESGELLITLKKRQHEKTGIVCEYDLDWNRAKELQQINEPSLIITSELAFPLISKIPEMLMLKNISVLAAKNITFGGSIACSGLLTLKDITQVILNEGVSQKQIILPQEMFDYKGNDLFGTHYTKLEEEHNLKVIII